MIIPGVQKPHWRPCFSQNAFWSGCRAPSPAAMPSIVVTLAPSAWTASIVQLFTARPSTWTVHAPHWLVSQPTCVPVRPRSSLQHLDEETSGFDVDLPVLAVDLERDVQLAHRGDLLSPIDNGGGDAWGARDAGACPGATRKLDGPTAARRLQPSFASGARRAPRVPLPTAPRGTDMCHRCTACHRGPQSTTE